MPVAAKAETLNERAAMIGCVHPWCLAWSGKCEKCRKVPLSGRHYPDHVSRKMYAESDENGH
jgi:hypothetical protein